jgi:hypothetical protein
MDSWCGGSFIVLTDIFIAKQKPALYIIDHQNPTKECDK